MIQGTRWLNERCCYVDDSEADGAGLIKLTRAAAGRVWVSPRHPSLYVDGSVAGRGGEGRGAAMVRYTQHSEGDSRPGTTRTSARHKLMSFTSAINTLRNPAPLLCTACIQFSGNHCKSNPKEFALQCLFRIQSEQGSAVRASMKWTGSPDDSRSLFLFLNLYLWITKICRTKWIKI